MNYGYYNTFLYVAKFKSISKAAKELYTSQPAVTRTIKLLEKELGCSLFVRSKYGMELTKEGEILYEHVNTAFTTLNKGEELISKSNTSIGGDLLIGSTITALDEFLFDYLKVFHKKHNNVKYRIYTQSSNQTVQKLNSGLIDIAFVTTPYTNSDDLVEYELKEFENIIICGEKFKHLTKKPIDIKELENMPFILLPRHMQLREYVDEIFKENNMLVDPTIEVDSAHMVAPMVEKDFGIGIVPKSLVKQNLEDGKIFEIKLKTPLPKRQVVALINKSFPTKTTAKIFVKEIK